MTINDPRDISNLGVWYSADAQTPQSDNTDIATLTDHSGNARDASIAATRVKYRTSLGPASGPAFDLPGNGSFTIPSAVLSGCTEAEIFVYVKAAAANTGQSLWIGNNGGGGAEHYSYTDGNIYETWCSNNRFSGAAGSPSVANWLRYNIWSKANDWKARLNEVDKITSASNTFTVPGSFAFGGGHANMVALVTTIIVYRRKLTTGERADVIAFMVANPSGGVPFVPPPPDDPINLAVDPDCTSADFTWDDGGGPAPTGYEVRLDGGTPVDVGLVNTHEFTSLTTGTLYDSPGAEVRAYNDDGFSGWVAITFTTDPVPGDPADAEVTPGCTNATMTWDPSSGDPDGYEVRLDGGAATDAGDVLTYEFTPLVEGTAYTGEVRAYNACGESEWVPVEFTTAVCPSETWFEVTINGGAPVNVGDDLCEVFTGLDPSTAYEVCVRACDADCCSDYVCITVTTATPSPNVGVVACPCGNPVT